MTSCTGKNGFMPSSTKSSRPMFAMLLFAIGFLASSAATAWTVMVACPDEFTGPPDCFDCQAFGDTAAIDSNATYNWSSRDFWGPFGNFDGPSGVDARNNHFNCDTSNTDVTAEVHLDVVITFAPWYQGHYTFVTCSGGGWT